MDTGLALQLLDATDLLEEDLEALLAAVKTLAIRHRRTPIMGRTHGVHAEPTSFGMVLAVWVDEIRRHQHRLEDAKQTVAVGKISGAVGSHATISPDLEERVCTTLGLAVEPISTQIVHRDRHAQFVSTLAQIAASLDKFATEIRHLQRTEVLEVEEPFAKGQTGSSAMPHKRQSGEVRAHQWLGQTVQGLQHCGTRECVALARTRHFALFRRASHNPRLLHPSGLHVGPIWLCDQWASGIPSENGGEHRRQLRLDIFPNEYFWPLWRKASLGKQLTSWCNATL